MSLIKTFKNKKTKEKIKAIKYTKKNYYLVIKELFKIGIKKLEVDVRVGNEFDWLIIQWEFMGNDFEDEYYPGDYIAIQYKIKNIFPFKLLNKDDWHKI